MSIGFAGLHQLLPALADLRETPGARALLLGTQDLSFTYDQAATFFGDHGFAFAPVPTARRRTAEGFGWADDAAWARYRHCMHHETLFEMVGLTPDRVDTIDISAFEGAKIVHDLNQPIDFEFEPYDLVLNQGTSEHIFDVRQVLWSLSDLTKVGGRVLHMVPAAFLNHGFYNFNAGLFSDFYGQAGWEKEELYYSLYPKSARAEAQALYGRVGPDAIQHMPDGFHMNVHARYRKTADAKNVYAVQGLYQGLHAGWADRRRSVDAPPGAAPTPAYDWLGAFQQSRADKRAAQELRRLTGDVIEFIPPVQVVLAVAEPELIERDLDAGAMFHGGGASWILHVPALPSGDSNAAPHRSQLLVLEDGEPLGPAHAMHADVAMLGQGRYSHWLDTLYLSTSDGSSPKDNGRLYRLRFPAGAWPEGTG